MSSRRTLAGSSPSGNSATRAAPASMSVQAPCMVVWSPALEEVTSWCEATGAGRISALSTPSFYRRTHWLTAHCYAIVSSRIHARLKLPNAKKATTALAVMASDLRETPVGMTGFEPATP
jgi:hypothetical protein